MLRATLSGHDVEMVGGEAWSTPVAFRGGGVNEEGVVGAGGRVRLVRAGRGAPAGGGPVEVAGQLFGDQLDLCCPLDQGAQLFRYL